MGRIHDGKLLALEDMRIEPSSDGVVFLASPNGAAPVWFAAVAQTRRMAAFENAGRDFPRAITYARRDDKSAATISEIGGENAIEIIMRGPVP
ncbi:MAG: DUF6265 family protein [Parvularculaceae bacterium]